MKCRFLDILPSSVRGVPERSVVSQVVNDTDLSCEDKIRRLKALTVHEEDARAQEQGSKVMGVVWVEGANEKCGREFFFTISLNFI